MSFIVAIDGPAGTGKGTITKLIAEELGLINIDTGAMYRCVALEALRKNVSDTEIEKVEEILRNIEIKFKRESGNIFVFLNGEDVTKEIRTPEVNTCVAKFAALKCVRDKMTPLQQEMGKDSNIIMEGRDIGTAIFPKANVKIYLDASPEERANRRYKQNIANGINQSYEEVLASIKQRDILETTRKLNPLRKAEDAIFVDTTHLTIEEVKQRILDIIKEKQHDKSNS